MTANTATFVRPSALTFEACDDLYAFLVQAQGGNVVLDGTNVSRLGGLSVSGGPNPLN